MSLRAIKKRETQQLSTPGNSRTTIFKKSPKRTTQNHNESNSKKQISNTIYGQLTQQKKQLGRSSHSNPELTTPLRTAEYQKLYDSRCLIRSKSDLDLNTLKSDSTAKHTFLTNAKSEVCLQSISVHNYKHTTAAADMQQTTRLSGARSHRDISQTAWNNNHNNNNRNNTNPRRMSECSLSYSQQDNNTDYANSTRSNSMFSSQLTLSSSNTAAAAVAIDPNTVLRVPIIGYEVMEERARFTVYKLRVENPLTHDCWLVLRRYTDFVRLNTKLKQAFPHYLLQLPRKKLFGDNFNAVFLDNRVQGLQIFVNSIMAKEDLRKYKLVREFFCLDEPPSYSESMEECRAIFEAQEETITHLKLQIQHKNDLILNLQQKLHDEHVENERLKESIKNSTLNCSHCSSANASNALNNAQ